MMKNNQVIIIALTYIFALLLSSLFGFPYTNFSWLQLKLPLLVYGSLGIIAGFVLPKFWRLGPQKVFYFLLPLMAIFATLYVQFSYPKPAVNDISKYVSKFQGNLTTITGKIIDNPSLNAQNKVRFLLKVKEVKDLSKNVSGGLYVTVPILQGTGLNPGQIITITGNLYEPPTNLNPGGFDFRKYLEKQGIFAGLKGVKITEYGEQKWGFYKVRERITKAQVRFLYSPVGPLVSSMVLGAKAVDLPNDIKDNFIQVGLAHILAASGFQVALLLGVLLQLLRNLSDRNKLIFGAIIIVFYVALTGVQASIIRAAIMGFGALIGVVTERKVKRFSFLILTAFILLIINPLWVFDLSFQLSFLATLGLIVTVEPIVNRLDFLPPTIANLIAIPLAANIWCLPLLIYVFKSVSLYSILINIIVAPLIEIISLLGMFSAVFALIFPLLGSLIAAVLYYPTLLIIFLANFSVSLPYSYLAIGQISLFQLIIIYGIIILLWLNHLCAKKWPLFTLFLISLIAIPLIYKNFNLSQVTVLAAQNEPIIIVQNHGKFALISTENPNNEKYIIKPFLAQQGINNLDVKIDLQDIKSNQITLNNNVKIAIFNNYLQLEIKDKKWWLIDKNLTQNTALPMGKNNSPDVIIWSGNTPLKWLDFANPQVAIASTNFLKNDLKKELKKAKIELYITGENGAIQWTEKQGFQTKFEMINDNL